MSGGSNAGDADVGSVRQQTIDALCEHFANDQLNVDEFERRVDLAHRARNMEELRTLLRDLPSLQVPARREEKTVPAPQLPPLPQPAHHSRESEFVAGILGGGSRKGRWIPARRTYGAAIMGGVELDFREALLPQGVTEVSVLAVWGGIEIIVPPGLLVECRGVGILGGFDHRSDSAVIPGSEAPVLRINGVAFMGGVDISERYPGESSGDARRRRRLERREQRRRLKRGRAQE